MYLQVALDFVLGVSPLVEWNPIIKKTEVLDDTKKADKAVA